MGNILDKILEDKRIEVAEAKKATPIEEVMDRCEGLPKCRNMYKAITKNNPRGLNVIAEVKKASPSAGLIRPDFEPAKIGEIYQKCGADAISVLTDQKYFQGKLEFVTEVKAAVDCPVMRKEFIVDPYQIYEARAAGADAILLIAEALNISELSDFMLLAHELTLSCLVEVHSLESLLAIRDIVDLGHKTYTLLGINNRDLTTMTVDINNTSRLSEFVDDKKRLVAESGIKTREDVLKLINVGVGGVLIGETLCRNDDIEAKFRELFG